jgi:hypothetical protein
MIEYVIYGKKENERYFDLLQEKVKVDDNGTIQLLPINSIQLANKVKDFYENLGYIVEIKAFDFSKPINLKQSFAKTINI